MNAIFISHSSRDAPVAMQVLGRLRGRGYESLFLDFDPDSGIKAGRDWERELYRNLKLASAVVVLCSPESMASRWCFAEITQAKALGKALFPLVIRPCEVVGPLADRHVIDLGSRGEEEGFHRLFEGLRAAGLDPGDSFDWDLNRPPFPGLFHFEAADAGIYFGREAEVRLTIETLTRMRRQGEPRLLVMVGSSGSGKSSLVRAGVSPRLEKDRSRWSIVPPFRPMSDPVGELARALTMAFPEGPARPDWKALRDRLKVATPAGTASSVLAEVADDLTMALGRREASMLLVVDQAEELIQGVAPAEASAFLAALLAATGGPGGRVFALLTLRSDFLGSFQNQPSLRGVPFATLPLGPMTVESFSRVIEGPADRAAIELEPGLARSMTADARTDDALPLLAFTLREMYERCRDASKFTLRVYLDDLGGIQGAVARVVERIKAEAAWTPEVNVALRRAFLELVRVNDEGRFTRRRARWADLPARAAPALEAFVRARLLTSDGDMVEVAHESLFRAWRDLAGWLDEAREFLLWRRRVAEDIEHWERSGFRASALLRGARLTETRKWRRSAPDALSPPERRFVAESWRRDSRLRLLTALTAAAVVLSLSVLSAYAWKMKGRAEASAELAKDEKATAIARQREAEHQARVATQGRLAAQSRADLEDHPERSLLLATEALRIALRSGEDPVSSAEIAMRLGLATIGGRPIGRQWMHVTALATAPGGRKVFTGGIDGAVRVYDLDHPEAPPAFLFGREQTLADLTPKPGEDLGDLGNPLKLIVSSVSSIAVSPDGRRLAAGFSFGGKVRVWDLNRPRTPPAVLECPGEFRDGVAIDAEGRRLVVTVEGKGPCVWDLSDLQARPEVIEGFKKETPFTAISPLGRRFATAGRTGEVKLWDLSDLKAAPIKLQGRGGTTTSVAISSDDGWLATGHNDGSVCIRDLKAPGAEPRCLKVHEGAVLGLAMSRDGARLISDDGKGPVVLWRFGPNPAPPQSLMIPRREDGRPWGGLRLSPDGRRLAINAGDNTLRVWDFGKHFFRDPVELRGHEAQITTNAFADDETLISGDEGGTVRLWDLKGPTAEPRAYPGPGPSLHALHVSPDGRRLVAGGWMGKQETALSWALDDPMARPVPLGGWVLGAEDLVMSPDGRRLFLRGAEGILQIYDARALAGKPRVLPNPKPPAKYARQLGATTFSPDGRYLIASSPTPPETAIFVWDLEGPEAGPVALRGHTGPITSLAVSPDGRRLASGGFDKAARIWDLRAAPGTPAVVLAGHKESVSAVAFSPDGRHVYTASRDATARIWTPDDPKAEPIVLAGHEGPIVSLALAPDGRLVTGSGDKTARVWDLESPGKEPVVLRGHVTAVRQVVVSPDGRHLATVGSFPDNGGSVRVWDLQDLGAEPVVFGPQPSIEVLRFSPDGRWLVAGCHDGDIRLWERTPGRMIEAAARTAGRNATLAEWQQFFPAEPSYRPTFPSLPCPEFDPAYKAIARNLTPTEWEKYFPGQPYREIFPASPAPRQGPMSSGGDGR